jgi:hypothetical protein
MSPSGFPGRRRPSFIPAARVSRRLREVCHKEGTLDSYDVRRIHPLRLYDIRLPSGHHLRIDNAGRWADVHTADGEHVIGLGSIRCPPHLIDLIIVPALVSLCMPEHAVPITDDGGWIGPDETYLQHLDEEQTAYPDPEHGYNDDELPPSPS